MEVQHLQIKFVTGGAVYEFKTLLQVPFIFCFFFMVKDVIFQLPAPATMPAVIEPMQWL